MSAKDEIVAFIKNAGEDLKVSTREFVPQLLARFEHQALFTVISDYMNDDSMSRKAWIFCIHTLCEIDPIAANQRFVSALQNEDADKRYRIVRLLRGCGTEHIVPALIQMLKDEPEPGIRFMVAYVLGGIGDKRAIPALEWSVANDFGVNHEDSTVSGAAKEAIEEINADSG